MPACRPVPPADQDRRFQPHAGQPASAAADACRRRPVRPRTSRADCDIRRSPRAASPSSRSPRSPTAYRRQHEIRRGTDDDISLRLKLEVSNLSGVGYQNLPTFGTRYIETTIRLRDGETNMLAGLIRDDERTTLEGIAGLSDLPIIGRLFGHTKKETKQTDIVLMLTPRIVRVLDLGVEDRARSGSAATRAEVSTSCRCPRGGAAAGPAGRRRRRHLPAGRRRPCAGRGRPAADQPADHASAGDAAHDAADDAAARWGFPPAGARRGWAQRAPRGADHVRSRARRSPAAPGCFAPRRPARRRWGPCQIAAVEGAAAHLVRPDTTMRCGRTEGSARIPDSCRARTAEAHYPVVDQRLPRPAPAP